MFNLVTSDMTELGGLWAGGKHPRVNGSDSTSQQQRRGCSEIEELSRHDTHTQPRNLFFFFFLEVCLRVCLCGRRSLLAVMKSYERVSDSND